MGNCTKIKHTCNGEQYATCVHYEVALPNFSQLTDCVSIEETTEELYSLVGEIREQINLSTLEADCLTLPLNITVENFSQYLINVICDMKDTIATQQSTIVTMQGQIALLQEQTCP